MSVSELSRKSAAREKWSSFAEDVCRSVTARARAADPDRVRDREVLRVAVPGRENPREAVPGREEAVVHQEIRATVQITEDNRIEKYRPVGRERIQ